MTRISTEQDPVTPINVFPVAPEDQRRLLGLLVKATETVMKSLPSFVSANLHLGLGGTRVTNYAPWRSREDFAAMLANPLAARHMRAASAIATAIGPHLCAVAHVDPNAGAASAAGEGAAA